MASVALGKFVEVIGLLSSGLGLDNFAPNEETGSVVKISVGLDGNGLSEAGGDLPDVRLFNNFGEFLGLAVDTGTIGDGSTGEVKVAHSDGQQAAYTLFSANGNAICIATASITWADGSQYGWHGDWAQECLYDWYYSNIFISGTSKQPKCLWIDANGDRPYTGFQIHWPAFAPTIPPNLRSPDDEKVTEITVADICSGGPAFRAVKTIFATPSPRRSVSRLFKRAPKPATTKFTPIPRFAATNSTNSTSHSSRSKFKDLIILDHNPNHSARELCESLTSRGPDFASYVESLFCRMSDKTLWPFCDNNTRTQCFSIESKQIITGQVKALSGAVKKYAKVIT
ncbi:hypothetical protein B0T16DRAFT_457202 [Cercophora newfieldiana]|uniref:Uncharacterized protein n=1 Tax=Cercophora newfieldiana TaxID=92897 RepID=A0AA39YBY9_9PEZI|nr:hypothetical protein B0T16DRAFT_457202 [Cercophora newfieldiana]